MRVFLDTNVLLDVFLKRVGEPASASVISACGEEENQGFVAVHTLSNAFYLIEKQRTRAEAWEAIRDVLKWACVAELATGDVMRTQRMEMSDFEDALQIAALRRLPASRRTQRSSRQSLSRCASRSHPPRIVLP